MPTKRRCLGDITWSDWTDPRPDWFGHGYDALIRNRAKGWSWAIPSSCRSFVWMPPSACGARPGDYRDLRPHRLTESHTGPVSRVVVASIPQRPGGSCAKVPLSSRRLRFRLPVLTTQHRDFLPQHQQFGVILRRRSCLRRHPPTSPYRHMPAILRAQRRHSWHTRRSAAHAHFATP